MEPIFSEGLDEEGWSQAVKKFTELKSVGQVEISAYEWGNTSIGMKELDIRIPNPTRRDLVCKARIRDKIFASENREAKSPIPNEDAAYADFEKDGQAMPELSDPDLLLLEIGFFEPSHAPVLKA